VRDSPSPLAATFSSTRPRLLRVWLLRLLLLLLVLLLLLLVLLLLLLLHLFILLRCVFSALLWIFATFGILLLLLLLFVRLLFISLRGRIDGLAFFVVEWLAVFTVLELRLAVLWFLTFHLALLALLAFLHAFSALFVKRGALLTDQALLLLEFVGEHDCGAEGEEGAEEEGEVLEGLEEFATRDGNIGCELGDDEIESADGHGGGNGSGKTEEH
jgi:hypothetical protein